MSKVRKCDRCGAFVKKHKAAHFKLCSAGFYDIPWTFDLCGKCASELARWMDIHRKYEKEREDTRKDEA